VVIEPQRGPLDLPRIASTESARQFDLSALAGNLLPGAASPGHAGLTRVSVPAAQRFATVLEGTASPGPIPHLAQTAWEVPQAAPLDSVAAALPERSLEALALRGLRELAASLVPGQPVEHADDVIRLITKLHDAVEMFCRCFIPVREACSRVIPPDDLEQAAIDRCRYRSSAYRAIEQALDPRAVAAALLDWRSDAQDAPIAIESILADLMQHHHALSHGALEGTRALLDELSPGRVQATTEHASSVLSRLGLASTRERELWQTYAERHASFDGGGDLFQDAYGTEFTRAYEARWRERGGGTK
jgi:hypothetical protein